MTTTISGNSTLTHNVNTLDPEGYIIEAGSSLIFDVSVGDITYNGSLTGAGTVTVEGTGADNENFILLGGSEITGTFFVDDAWFFLNSRIEDNLTVNHDGGGRLIGNPNGTAQIGGALDMVTGHLLLLNPTDTITVDGTVIMRTGSTLSIGYNSTSAAKVLCDHFNPTGTTSINLVASDNAYSATSYPIIEYTTSFQGDFNDITFLNQGTSITGYTLTTTDDEDNNEVLLTLSPNAGTVETFIVLSTDENRENLPTNWMIRDERSTTNANYFYFKDDYVNNATRSVFINAHPNNPVTVPFMVNGNIEISPGRSIILLHPDGPTTTLGSAMEYTTSNTDGTTDTHRYRDNRVYRTV